MPIDTARSCLQSLSFLLPWESSFIKVQITPRNQVITKAACMATGRWGCEKRKDLIIIKDLYDIMDKSLRWEDLGFHSFN